MKTSLFWLASPSSPKTAPPRSTSLTVLPIYCFSQVQFSFSTGLAGFQMDDMKRHQSEIERGFPIDMKVLESFPSFWSYEFDINMAVTKRLNVGPMIGYTSTGGRMHYKDYSGTIKCDQVATSLSLGALSELVLFADDNWTVSITGKTGATFGRYKLDVLFDVNQQSDSENVKFHSTNFFFEPGFMVMKHVVKSMSVKFSAGYNINLVRGKLIWNEDKNLYLLDSRRDKVTLDWTGYRIGLGVSVAF
jgi:hypothetical protein